MKLSYLGIMKAKEHQFNRKGIYTVEDLVRFLPRKYNDFSRETGILPEDQTSCLIATVTRVNSYHNGTPMMIAFCTIQPTGEKLLVKWFRQNYMLNKISACVGRDVYICAKLVYDEKYKNYSATMPELFEPKISEGKRILPVYPKIPGMSAEYLTEKMQAAVGIPEATSETCPYDLVAEEKLLPIQKALYYLHFPKTMEQIQQGQDRMLFDDLLYFALNNEYASRNSAIGSAFSVKTLGAVNRIVESLPYKLTADQKAAIDSMIETLKDVDFDVIVGTESRGFIFGVPIAYAMGKPFVPCRKKGKLPCETVTAEYDLEYGSAAIELHKDSIKKGQKVVIVDDLIATGGTVKACASLVEELGGEVAKIVFLMELAGLKGREQLSQYDVSSLIIYEGK